VYNSFHRTAGGWTLVVGVGLMSHRIGQLSKTSCHSVGILYDPFHDEKPIKTNQPHRLP
jgi:hypothetical protein